jgi:uncharacterized membrane protein YbhN (UPF0104 family)
VTAVPEATTAEPDSMPPGAASRPITAAGPAPRTVTGPSGTDVPAFTEPRPTGTDASARPSDTRVRTPAQPPQLVAETVVSPPHGHIRTPAQPSQTDAETASPPSRTRTRTSVQPSQPDAETASPPPHARAEASAEPSGGGAGWPYTGAGASLDGAAGPARVGAGMPGDAPRASVAGPGVWLRWAGRGVVVAALGVCLVVFRDRLPDLGALWRVTVHAGPGWLACVVGAQLASMGMFARVQRRLLRAGGVRMPWFRAVRMTYAGNALSTTLPAGPALSVAFNFRQYRRAGAPAPLATSVVVLGGVIMTGGYAVVGLVALLAEPHSRGLAVAGLAGVVVAVGSVVLLGRRAGLVRAVVRPLRRHRQGDRVLAALRGGGLRLGLGDWSVLAAMSLLNWVFDILSLAAAGRAVGLHTTLYAITLAYFAAQLAGSLLPLLPGGLGAIEGSLAASLVAFGAVAAPAAAAVALYRLVSFWGVVGAGWVAWLAVRNADDSVVAGTC